MTCIFTVTRVKRVLRISFIQAVVWKWADKWMMMYELLCLSSACVYSATSIKPFISGHCWLNKQSRLTEKLQTRCPCAGLSLIYRLMEKQTCFVFITVRPISRASNAEKSRKKITRKSLFQLKLFMKNNIPEEFPPLRLIMWSVISLTLVLSVCLVSRCSLAPSRCSSLIRTRGSISACCCASSWTTDRKWVLSRAGWSKSSPNPPRRDSPWRTLIVGLFHF